MTNLKNRPMGFPIGRCLVSALFCGIERRAQADERILIGGGHQLAGG